MTINSTKFVIADANKCIGCKICEVACHAAHDQVNYTVGAQQSPIIPRLHVLQANGKSAPVQCRHCEDAPCANVCAVNAISEQDGKILINEKTCIGCKACVIACPFGAIDLLPQYVNGQHVMQANLRLTPHAEETKYNITAYKCDLCDGKETQACIEACPENALRLFDYQQESKARSYQAAFALHTL